MKSRKEYDWVDIPETLTPASFKGLQLKSSNPPLQPRNPPEPKKKAAQWPQAEELRTLHERYGGLAEKALNAAHEDGITEWCVSRTVKGEDKEPPREDIRQWQDMFKVMTSFGDQVGKSVIELSKDSNEVRIEEIYSQILFNPHDIKSNLSIHLNSSHPFHIPARSSFILDTFPSASKALTTYTLSTSRFDVIVLDPPWHNKAVSHLKTKKHLSYNTMQNILTELPPVGNWLAPGGLIAIWCTNNLKTINKVKTVLFKRWGVVLIAEWIWLKVTIHGDPVVDLNSSFRKPYEILLIARKSGGKNPSNIPERKVIVAVPGYHSQKPCLKGIFDEILLDGYRGCELYARNLVEGWMTVGDECLKFMEEDYWEVIPTDGNQDQLQDIEQT